MRTDVDFPPAHVTGFRSSKIRVWQWVLAGVLAILVLAYLDAPAWAFALALLIWGAAGALQLQSDSMRAMPRLAQTEKPPPAVEPADPPAWRSWLAGWYWETDVDGVLTVLTPGAGRPLAQQVNWDALSRFLDAGPALLSCWHPEQTDASDLQRLAFCLAQRQEWSGELLLPWPSALSGWCGTEPQWRCRLRGQARRDARGQFAGFCGVWVLDGADVVRATTEGQPDSDAARMLESEQEALRYALSHDLRAPLRVVEGFTRIVKEDYGQQLDRMGQDHLDRVLAAATRMHGMIDAILAQAQLASTPLQRVSVDITALAREIGDDVLSSSDNRQTARIVVADGLRIDADPQLVRRVLENLIGNAFKYSAKVAEPRVDVGMMPATNPTVFYVRDNGAGFDMQHADKLFGMFQRLHSAKEFPGTGVGLAGVQNIIRRHGGRVWAEARPGEGACFYFTLMDVQTAQQRTTRSE